jgi:hypothetical protein
MVESDLAWSDERRDAIDRIAERCAQRGITDCQEVVAAIRDGLAGEMRPLIEVEILIGTGRVRASATPPAPQK